MSQTVRSTLVGVTQMTAATEVDKFFGASSLEAARSWIDRGYHPIPIPYRKKKPVTKTWQELRLTHETATAYFSTGATNLGIILGDEYGSADVDCDCPEAIHLACHFLPETGLIFGRQSAP